MKKKYSLLIFALLGSLIKAQNNDLIQKFPKLDFQISTPCSLYENTSFKQLAKGQVSIVESLVCASSRNDSANASIYNINIYRESGGAKEFIYDYAAKLQGAGISYQRVVVDGIPMLEYTIIQNGVRAKALVFYRYDKSYLLQVTSRSNLSEKFNLMKKSFKKLN
ncbi:hypothetical protein [Chryseobacterium sp. R2A-55]|uniref:hypothetical protein n=1 Tax=Chryseobacterium sp. R2A-55 TaxID=2744445 RepID=UPI001F24B1A9|nr:hypothetical protein [Chryseobacterium sp. R2A-55]